MKRFIGPLGVIALIVLISMSGGCGGGGGTGSGTGTGSGPLHALQVGAYNNLNQMLDARNIVVGDVVQLDITARDKNNILVVVPVSGWTTTAPAGVATVSSSGLVHAIGAAATPYRVSVVYGGVLYSAPIVVTASQDLVTGLVRNSANPIQDVIVRFYDASTHVVGVAYTARDGTFRASLPSTAVRFTIDLALADANNVYYYPQFAYKGSEYLVGTSCLAKMPTPLSPTAVTPMASPIVPAMKTSGPPAPPTGCLG